MAKLLAFHLLGADGEPEEGIRPAGLGARDTLRIEAGMPLYGHELDENTDPLSAAQGWCVDLEKNFVGAEALRGLARSGPRQTLVGLQLDGRRTARQGFSVQTGGKCVGRITSGCLSPTLGASIAMAFVDMDHAGQGAKLAVDFGGKPVPAKVVKLPFYTRPNASET